MQERPPSSVVVEGCRVSSFLRQHTVSRAQALLPVRLKARHAIYRSSAPGFHSSLPAPPLYRAASGSTSPSDPLRVTTPTIVGPAIRLIADPPASTPPAGPSPSPVPAAPMVGGLFDLEKHFAFYGAYHDERINKAIHIVCVWPLLFTAILLVSLIPGASLPPPPALVGLPGHEYLIPNLALLVALVYAVFYMGMDHRMGWLAAGLAIGCWVGSNAIVLHGGTVLALKIAVIVQVVCWSAQFLGHGIFERRHPALLDNLLQSILMAPFFVLLEVVMSLGYEPWPGFKARVRTLVDADISAFKRSKQKLLS